MDIQSADKKLLEDHELLFNELKQIPKTRAMTYHTERSEGHLIAKPRFDPPNYVWPSKLLSKVQNHLQKIWDFFERSQGVDTITRALIHPEERRSSKNSIIFLLERDIWCTDDVYGDYLIEKTTKSLVISYYRRGQKRKQFSLPSMTDTEIEAWICNDARQQIEAHFSYLWKYLETEIVTYCKRLSTITSDSYAILQDLEKTLRTFIVVRLKAKYGDRWWIQGIPEDIRQQCQERKDKGENIYPWFGTEEHELIDYADFTDYAKIIARRDNWRMVFEPVIRKKEVFIAKLHELEPIRNKIAHIRPLNGLENQTLTLYAQQIKMTLQ